MLIFYLKDKGFYQWWTKSGDPCSLYADDTVIFLHGEKQLRDVIQHIQLVGTFTGLNLNLTKTIAFMPKAETSRYCLDVEITSKPIKYLGAQLGLGDLTLSNFEKPLKNAQNKLSA